VNDRRDSHYTTVTGTPSTCGRTLLVHVWNGIVKRLSRTWTCYMITTGYSLVTMIDDFGLMAVVVEEGVVVVESKEFEDFELIVVAVEVTHNIEGMYSLPHVAFPVLVHFAAQLVEGLRLDGLDIPASSESKVVVLSGYAVEPIGYTSLSTMEQLLSSDVRFEVLSALTDFAEKFLLFSSTPRKLRIVVTLGSYMMTAFENSAEESMVGAYSQRALGFVLWLIGLLVY
jgi:hypothetical protein